MGAKAGLTKPNELFIDNYFNNGFNATKAYMDAFPGTAKSRGGARYSAYRLLNKPFIKMEVEKRWDEIKSLNIIERQEIVLALKDLMDEAIENKDSATLLKTIDTINKMQGNYTTLIEANVNQQINLTIPGLEPDKDEDIEDNEQ